MIVIGLIKRKVNLMDKMFILSALCVVALSGCASNEQACEDVTVVAEEAQQCQALQRQIEQAKGQPLVRTELERRFQQDCLDLRFYRDEQQPAVCENKEQIEAARNDYKNNRELNK